MATFGVDQFGQTDDRVRILLDGAEPRVVESYEVHAGITPRQLLDKMVRGDEVLERCIRIPMRIHANCMSASLHYEQKFFFAKKSKSWRGGGLGPKMYTLQIF